MLYFSALHPTPSAFIWKCGSDELFHLFRRFHDHTEGTGVGLYLVNRIVQSNGGRVEVESEVGVGTTFRLYL